MIQINGTEITQDAIAREMQYHPAETKEQAFHDAATALTIREVLRQQCVKEGLCEQMPEDPVQEEALIEQLLDNNIKLPTIDEQSRQRYYQQNQEKFCNSPLVEARHILLAAAPEDEAAIQAATERSEQLINELKKHPQQFESLAQQHSACTSKQQGGHLGQLSKGSTVAEFETVLFQAEAGLIEKPIVSRYGVHIVEVLHSEPAMQLPYEIVKEKISAYLQQNARQQAISLYLHWLLAQQEIKGFEWQ